MEKSSFILESVCRWDEYFMNIAYMVSMKSKDPKARVGCVIVKPNMTILSTGYNGFPRGVSDYQDRYLSTDFKYAVSNHAEENAILQAARNGINLENSLLYTNWMPCVSCARSIIQVGIKEVIYHAEYPGNNPNLTKESKHRFDISRIILGESGIILRSLSCKIIVPTGLYKGKTVDL